jgi:UDP-N-acetylmuramoylalanine--D-glutamate ligase
VNESREYEGKTALVVGAARSGAAAAEFLLAHGARVVLTDRASRERLSDHVEPLVARAGGASLVLELGGHRAESFRACDFVVLSPGVPASLPELDHSRAAGIPILAEVELAYRHLKGKILGITGSNGKTTTTQLVGEMLRGGGLRGYTAGNIGTPLIRYAASSQDADVYATELSSFQLETIDRFRPAVAAVLNLTPDHMDRYRSFDDYIAAKRRIFMNQRAADFAVLNADDPRTAALAFEVPSTPFFFSRRGAVKRGAFVRAGELVYRGPGGDQAVCRRDDIRLKGDHNLENVLAAAAIALLGGVDAASLRDSVRGFRGVEHRLEWVADVDGVSYFNDSKATNVDATVKSLEAFPGRIHLILGGRDKGGDFATLRPLVTERVRRAVLIGEAAGKIAEALSGAAEMTRAASLPEAVAICRRRAEAGDVVLLAPACASFDMFDNYEHRGRVFKEAVQALKP